MSLNLFHRDCFILAVLVCSAQPALAQSEVAASARLHQWSGNRLDQKGAATANAEAWGKAKLPVGPSVTLRGEGWVALDPRGDRQVGGDVREALIEIEAGSVRAQAGRQIFGWGRADRVNPTDILGARDYRRLTVEDDENRLGQASVSLSLPIAGGTMSGYWVPEFRATSLPQDVQGQGLPVSRVTPDDKASYALRYERFGSAFDMALTLADVPDRTPWFSLGSNRGGPALIMRHPRVRMVGADLAATLGDYGLRLEAAHYHHGNGLQGVTRRTPKFAATLGVDRSFPGQWMVIAQAIVRVASQGATLAGAQSPLADRNAVAHGAWRKTITGATLSIRKSFAGDRGRVELTGATLSGGGRFLQARTSFAINDDVRIQLFGDHFDGGASSYFGRQSANTIAMIGLRVGY